MFSSLCETIFPIFVALGSNRTRGLQALVFNLAKVWSLAMLEHAPT